MKTPETSWGGVADWYNQLLSTDEDSFQRRVILPNLLRLVAPKAGLRVLDLACGSGFFSRELLAACPSLAPITAVDLSAELIALAKQAETKNISYFVAPAHKLGIVEKASQDVVMSILAIQNIAEVKEVFAEVRRVLAPGGRLLLVLNHPAFRIPKFSAWGWDEAEGRQYRRVDRYLSEQRSEIQMHPGSAPGVTTLSFHRPLQWYAKLLTNQGFVISRLEEWVSHRESQRGPRQVAEDLARKEIPLFLYLEARLG